MVASPWEPFAHVLLIVAVGAATLVAAVAVVVGVIAEGIRQVGRLLGLLPRSTPRHARRK